MRDESAKQGRLQGFHTKNERLYRGYMSGGFDQNHLKWKFAITKNGIELYHGENSSSVAVNDIATDLLSSPNPTNNQLITALGVKNYVNANIQCPPLFVPTRVGDGSQGDTVSYNKCTLNSDGSITLDHPSVRWGFNKNQYGWIRTDDLGNKMFCAHYGLEYSSSTYTTETGTYYGRSTSDKKRYSQSLTTYTTSIICSRTTNFTNPLNTQY